MSKTDKEYKAGKVALRIMAYLNRGYILRIYYDDATDDCDEGRWFPVKPIFDKSGCFLRDLDGTVEKQNFSLDRGIELDLAGLIEEIPEFSRCYCMTPKGLDVATHMFGRATVPVVVRVSGESETGARTLVYR